MVGLASGHSCAWPIRKGQGYHQLTAHRWGGRTRIPGLPLVTLGPRDHTLETTQAWGPTQRLSLWVRLSVCTGVSWVLITDELGGAHETYSEVFL